VPPRGGVSALEASGYRFALIGCRRDLPCLLIYVIAFDSEHY